MIEAAQLERDNESRVRELERTNEGLDAVNTEVQVQFEELKSRRIATRELAEAVENLNSVINETDDATQKKSLKRFRRCSLRPQQHHARFFEARPRGKSPP